MKQIKTPATDALITLAFQILGPGELTRIFNAANKYKNQYVHSGCPAVLKKNVSKCPKCKCDLR